VDIHALLGDVEIGPEILLDGIHALHSGKLTRKRVPAHRFGKVIGQPLPQQLTDKLKSLIVSISARRQAESFHHKPKPGAKKRITLTLPAAPLEPVLKIAATHNTTLSAVVAEAFEAGLDFQARSQRAKDAFAWYRKAFGGLTEEESFLVSGVDLEPIEAR